MSEGQPAPDASPDWAHSFGGVVDAYDRAGLPPLRLVLVGQEAATVLELGAGATSLTRQLVARPRRGGHRPRPGDAEPAAARPPRRRHARDARGGAPVGDRGFDVVVAFKRSTGSASTGPRRSRGLAAARWGLVWNWRDDRIRGMAPGRAGRHPGAARRPDRGDRRQRVVRRSRWRRSRTGSSRPPHRTWSSRGPTSRCSTRGGRPLAGCQRCDQYGRGMDGMRLPYVTSAGP